MRTDNRGFLGVIKLISGHYQVAKNQLVRFQYECEFNTQLNTKKKFTSGWRTPVVFPLRRPKRIGTAREHRGDRERLHEHW